MSSLKSCIVATALVAMIAGTAQTASGKSDAEYRAAIEACKAEASPKKRDECVSNAKNRFERGKGAEKKTEDAKQKAKGKAADKMKKSMGLEKGKGKKK